MLIGLGLADAQTLEGPPPLDGLIALTERSTTDTPNEPTTADTPETTTPDTPTPERTTGVKKQREVSVERVIEGTTLEMNETDESTFLEQIGGTSMPEVQKRVLLKDGDRAIVMAWVDTPHVKMTFRSLKQALLNSFTAQQQDLVDEVDIRDGLPPRNILTFYDPGISDERVLFVRVRQRLYEFRMVEDARSDVDALVDRLTE